MITDERARQILASYGGSAVRWPERERVSMQHKLASDGALRVLQQEALLLDSQLAELFTEQESASTERLAQRILASLPERTADNGQENLNSCGRAATWLDALNSIFTRCCWGWATAAAVLSVVCVIAVNRLDGGTAVVAPQLAGAEDEWQLMADALDNSAELELLAVLEPELFEDDQELL